ncbi:hypothetical protein [Tunturiibacter empetritectus]
MQSRLCDSALHLRRHNRSSEVGVGPGSVDDLLNTKLCVVVLR